MRALIPLAVLGLLLGACIADGADAVESAPRSDVEGDVVTVHIRDMAYEPATVEIEAGTTVQWVWDDAPIPHDVSGKGFKSEVQTTGIFAFTFEDPGTFDYLCTLHPQMEGVVTVLEGA